MLYWSRIIVCVATSTKYPLIKYTPALIVAEDPVYAEAFWTAVTATDVPAEFWSTSLFWNSKACTLFVILPPEVYFT